MCRAHFEQSHSPAHWTWHVMLPNCCPLQTQFGAPQSAQTPLPGGPKHGPVSCATVQPNNAAVNRIAEVTVPGWRRIRLRMSCVDIYANADQTSGRATQTLLLSCRSTQLAAQRRLSVRATQERGRWQMRGTLSGSALACLTADARPRVHSGGAAAGADSIGSVGTAVRVALEDALTTDSCSRAAARAARAQPRARASQRTAAAPFHRVQAAPS
jgi:hypothetical protein